MIFFEKSIDYKIPLICVELDIKNNQLTVFDYRKHKISNNS